MHTGDLGVIDGTATATSSGASKDMLIRGGENIYPREIEEFLFRHPGVRRCRCSACPTDSYGEEVCAWIVLKPGERCTEEEYAPSAAGQIAHYKVPRYVRFGDELPMTVTGKAQKFLMRAAMVEDTRPDRGRHRLSGPSAALVASIARTCAIVKSWLKSFAIMK